jgi:hypothetical protein
MGPGVQLPDSMNDAAGPREGGIGDEPVFDHIASLPEPHRSIAEAVGALAAATIPGLQRSLKRGTLGKRRWAR